jgi:hypothetical protein
VRNSYDKLARLIDSALFVDSIGSLGKWKRVEEMTPEELARSDLRRPPGALVTAKTLEFARTLRRAFCLVFPS